MLGIRSVARESGKSGDMCKYYAFVCVCVHVYVYLGVHGDCRGSSPSDPPVAPMWSFADRKWPRIPPVGQTPTGKGPAPSTSEEETSVKLSLSCCQSEVGGSLCLWAVKGVGPWE